jgi:hypothetical protein
MINFEFQFGEAISSRIRGRTREQPEAYLYGTLRIASAENEESGRKRPPKSKAYELFGLGKAECNRTMRNSSNGPSLPILRSSPPSNNSGYYAR